MEADRPAVKMRKHWKQPQSPIGPTQNLNWGWGPRGNLALSWEEQGVAGCSGISWVEDSNAVKHSMMHRTGPPQQKVIKPNSARFGKSWPNWMDSSALSGKLLSSLQSPAQPLSFLYSSNELPFTIPLKSQMSLHPGLCSQKTFYPSKLTHHYYL